MPRLGIGQLAKQAGVAIDTVRYYERSGLLAPAARLASGYRRYGSAELKRLRFIRRAKTLGFTLEEIRELLTLGEGADPDASSPPAHGSSSRPAPRLSSRPKGEISRSRSRSLPAVEMTADDETTADVETTADDDVARIRRTAQRRLADVESRIAELERMREGLATLIAACPGHGRADACPILNALAGEDLP